MKRLLTVMLVFSMMGQAQAQEKSVGVATVLGLDLIPGDSLLYANKPKQALGNVAMALVGGGTLAWGLYYLHGPHVCDGCVADSVLEIPTYTLISFGSSMLLGSVLWDLIGGISGVQSHNKIQPSFAVSDRGGMAGIEFQF